jgi:hypothetical protein
MTVPQITIRLLPQLKGAFEHYATVLGLRASELTKLLIVREKNLRRLAALKIAGKPPRRLRQQRGSAVPMETVTAHVSSLTEVREFDRYAKNCALNRNTAGAWLLETELREKWLEKALRSDRLFQNDQRKVRTRPAPKILP